MNEWVMDESIQMSGTALPIPVMEENKHTRAERELLHLHLCLYFHHTRTYVPMPYLCPYLFI